jgi:exoribonuclease R
VADVKAFSIDDVTTTEIDDAFSVTHLADGNVKVGIHIAAPGLGIKPDDAVDKLARTRMSTVYMPGDKITMLPDAIVNAFTLAEGKTCPALSLYATLNPAGRCPPKPAPRWCRSRTTCATTTSTTWSTKKPWPAARATIRTRTTCA